jgi:hypothetical protein
MTTHTLQQTLANARQTHARLIVGVSLTLLILIIGALAYISATAPRAAQPISIQIVASSADASASPAELDYLRVLSDEQAQRYIAARPTRFQAQRFTRGPVLPDELNYLRVLNDEQVGRYIAARQSTQAR